MIAAEPCDGIQHLRAPLWVLTRGTQRTACWPANATAEVPSLHPLTQVRLDPRIQGLGSSARQKL